MTVQETTEYIKGMKRTAEKDTDKRAMKCVDAMDSVLDLIDDRRCLQNRCLTLSNGLLCVFCDMECEARQKTKSR